MPEAVSDSRPKHPGRVAGGRMGARRRWGDPRHVALTELQPAIRAAVLALIQADEATKKTVPVVSETSTGTAKAEVQRVGAERSAA
jgi:hypothetical protein